MRNLAAALQVFFPYPTPIKSPSLNQRFPHVESVSDLYPIEFDTYCLKPAKEMRSIIREQMGYADNKEAGKNIPDIKTLGCDV